MQEPERQLTLEERQKRKHALAELLSMTGAVSAALSSSQPRERQEIQRTSTLSGKAHARRKKRNKMARESRRRNR
jgi:hypothetical protein